MKKFTLFAAMAAVAVSASAQTYNIEDCSTLAALAGSEKNIVDYHLMEQATLDVLTNDPNVTLNYLGPDDQTSHLWWWNEGASSMEAGVDPGVDGEAGYNIFGLKEGWVGYGLAIDQAGALNLSHFGDNTVFHMAYKAVGGKIASFWVTLLDSTKELNSKPASFCCGASTEGKPSLAAAPGDDWQAISITLNELKKEVPSFDLQGKDAWFGNIICYGGAVEGGWNAGAGLGLDAVYFVTPGDSNAIESIENNAADIVVSNRTISCAGANSIALYNLNGQLVKSAATSVLGLENVATGVYVAKAGNSVAKVAVK